MRECVCAHSHSSVVTIPCGVCCCAWQIQQSYTRTLSHDTPLQRWHKRPLASLLIAVKGTPVCIYVCVCVRERDYAWVCVWQSTWTRLAWHDLGLSSLYQTSHHPLANYASFIRAFSLFLSSHTSIFLVLSLLTSFLPIPLFSHSLCMSSPRSVTLPLFSARCDQLGDISPTNIPGDRTSGGHALLHLSSFCLPSVSLLNTWPSWHFCSSSPSAPLLFMANNRPHSSPEPPPQSCALIPYRADSDISASTLLSSVSSVIYPPFSLPFMFWLHVDSDTSPFPTFFPSALSGLFQPFLFLCLRLPLSHSLQVAVHNNGPVYSPVCQPFTCILATTSPLALMLHAEQANKTPGEWRTSTLVYPPPSIRSVIPSHIKRRA